MNDEISFYELLGVRPDASPAEVKAGYRAAMRKFHPDVGGSDVQAALFQRAYEVLSDPQKRRVYDEQQRAGSSTSREPDADRGRSSAEAASTWGVDDVWVDDQAPPRPGSPPREPAPDSVPTSPSGSTTAAGVRQVVPAFNAVRLPYGVAAAIWGASWLVTLVYMSATGWNGFAVASVAVVGVLALPWHWFDRIPTIRIGAIVAAAVVAFVCINRGDEEPPFLWWSLGVLGSLVVVACLSAARSRTARLNRVISAADVFENNTWGSPGHSIVAESASFGGDDAHQYATRCTDQALGPIYALEGVKVLHGLWWPNSQERIIDHLVVAGNRVAILESRALPAGEYWCDESGVLLRGQEHFLGGQTWATAAATAWQQQVPRAVVCPFLVAHPIDGGQVLFAGQMQSGIRCVTAASLAAELRAFLAEGAGVVDRWVLAGLLTDGRIN